MTDHRDAGMRTSNTIDAMGAYSIVNAAVDRAGSQAAFARRAGISKQQLNAELHARERARFSDATLRAAGLRRTIRTVVEYSFLEGAQ